MTSDSAWVLSASVSYLYNGERETAVISPPQGVVRLGVSKMSAQSLAQLPLNSIGKKTLPALAPSNASRTLLPSRPRQQLLADMARQSQRLLPAPTQLHSSDTGHFIPRNNCSLGNQVPHLPPPLPLLRLERPTTPMCPSP